MAAVFAVAVISGTAAWRLRHAMTPPVLPSSPTVNTVIPATAQTSPSTTMSERPQTSPAQPQDTTLAAPATDRPTTHENDTKKPSAATTRLPTTSAPTPPTIKTAPSDPRGEIPATTESPAPPVGNHLLIYGRTYAADTAVAISEDEIGDLLGVVQKITDGAEPVSIGSAAPELVNAAVYCFKPAMNSQPATYDPTDDPQSFTMPVVVKQGDQYIFYSALTEQP